MNKIITLCTALLVFVSTAMAQNVTSIVTRMQLIDSITRVSATKAQAQVVIGTHVGDCIILRGVVVDDSSGEPMAFASVRVLEKETDHQIAGMETDFDGMFYLRIPKGGYDVIFFLYGYQECVFSGIICDTDTTLPVVRLVKDPNVRIDPIKIEVNDMDPVISY